MAYFFTRKRRTRERREEIKVSAPYRQRFTALKLHTTTKFWIFHFYVPKTLLLSISEILETFDLERPCHDRLPCSIWLSREARERSKHPVFVIVLPKGAHADMRGGGYNHACYPCLYLTIKGSQLM